MADAARDARLYLGGLCVAAVEGNALELDVLSEALLGFGIRRLQRFRIAAEAQAALRRDQVDLVFVGSVPAPLDEYGFIGWLRREGLEANRTAPVVLLTGHTQRANVLRARDCGASVVLAKPVQPAALYDRVGWLTRDKRGFVATPTYAGPDRRFQKLGPPAGAAGRRKDDLPLEMGEATEANMSQSEIDAMLTGSPPNPGPPTSQGAIP